MARDDNYTNYVSMLSRSESGHVRRSLPKIYDEIPVCICGKDWSDHLKKNGEVAKRFDNSSHQIEFARRERRQPEVVTITSPQPGWVTGASAGRVSALCHRKKMPASINYFLNKDGVRLPNPINSMLEGKI